MMRRNRSKTDLKSMKRFRKFRDAMDKLMEEPVTIKEKKLSDLPEGALIFWEWDGLKEKSTVEEILFEVNRDRLDGHVDFTDEATIEEIWGWVADGSAKFLGIENFHTDDDHLKPVYAMANLIVAQQQAFVDLIHGDTDER